MVTKTIKGYEHTCLRCDHTWQSFDKNIQRCARCKDPNWNKPRKWSRKNGSKQKVDTLSPVEQRRIRRNSRLPSFRG